MWQAHHCSIRPGAHLDFLVRRTTNKIVVPQYWRPQVSLQDHGNLDNNSGVPDSDSPRPDDIRLTELRRRYEMVDSSFVKHGFWSRGFVDEELRLDRFREDNCYLWQLRRVGENPRLKYFTYASYLAGIDSRGLLERLGEDGKFGCITFEYERYPRLSLDLLDSINEISFLDRHWSIFDRKGFSVVDIGAGYGRLAHRMVQSVQGIDHYYCLDAIAESTFLCEWYIRYRGIDRQATAVPLDEIKSRFYKLRPDLAVNIHSFSEMTYDAIEAWILWLASIAVPVLLIVSNEGRDLLSMDKPESLPTRRDCLPLLAQHGYKLTVVEPIVTDADVRELTGMDNYFMFFGLE
jgi:hypothetical protein